MWRQAVTPYPVAWVAAAWARIATSGTRIGQIELHRHHDVLTTFMELYRDDRFKDLVLASDTNTGENLRAREFAIGRDRSHSK
jgi:hypothetical protein